MNFAQLIAKLSVMHASRESPVKVYDSTDTFQILGVKLQYDRSFPSKFVLIAQSQYNDGTYCEKTTLQELISVLIIDLFDYLGRVLTVGELIDASEMLIRSFEEGQRHPEVSWSSDLKRVLSVVGKKEIEVLFPNGVQYTLADIDFDSKDQVYAITVSKITSTSVDVGFYISCH